MKSTKRKIKIGIVCSPRLGGSGVVGSELARYLSKKSKYKVVFIGDDYPFRFDDKEIYYHKVEKLEHALFIHPLKESALTEGIVEAVIKHRLDIIHAHFAIPYAHCAVQAKQILEKMGINISIVTTLHGTDVINLGREVPAVMKHILEESSAVTAVSIDLAGRTEKLYHPKKDIHVIYNFIETSSSENLRRRAVLRSRFAKPDEKIFVHISNFRAVKRVSDTLRVFFKAQSTIPGVLLLIGEGPDLENARKLANVMKGEKSIHLIGSVKNPYKYLQIADALLITSEYESFGLVALEAMASGVPVFGTRVGGLPEVVTHGESGYLAGVGEIDKLAGYIKRHFLSSSKEIQDMQKNAINNARYFDADKIIKGYEYIYAKLTSVEQEKKEFI